LYCLAQGIPIGAKVEGVTLAKIDRKVVMNQAADMDMGLYLDDKSEKQHKFGPYKGIIYPQSSFLRINPINPLLPQKDGKTTPQRYKNDIKQFYSIITRIRALGNASRSVKMTKEDILEYLRINKSEFQNKFGVIKIGLFGSFARDEQNENSDIDLAIELEKDKKNLKNFFAFKRELEKRFNKKVDIGIENTLKPIVKEYVKKEIIYA